MQRGISATSPKAETLPEISEGLMATGPYAVNRAPEDFAD
jgi:hypothetical protein